MLPNHVLKKTENIDDFDERQIIRIVDDRAQHLIQRIALLEDKLGSNEKIGDTFYEASSKVVKLQTLQKETILKLIMTDHEIKLAVAKLVNDTDRNFFYKTVRQFKTIIYTLFIVVITALTQDLIRKYM
jgi:hypothetical protein